MSGDCTTCKHAETCDEYFSCELHYAVNERADLYIGYSCDDYEEREDGLTLTQVWDWR